MRSRIWLLPNDKCEGAIVRLYVCDSVAAPNTLFLLDKYMPGNRVEVDVNFRRNRCAYSRKFMEHIERAGIHSGDSIAVYPPPSALTTT
jgi:carbamoyl-phosphate synthase large subunit